MGAFIVEQSLPKLLGGLVPVSIALVVFIQAYWSQRQTYQKYWLIALCCYWLRHVVAIFIHDKFSASNNIAWLYGLLVMIGAYLLLRGTLEILNRKQILWPLWINVFGTLGTKVFILMQASVVAVAFPTCLTVSLSYLCAGVAINQSSYIKNGPGRMLALAHFIMFLLQALFTPIALAFVSNSSWHFLFSGLTEAFLTTSLIIFYFHTREQALAEAKDRAANAVKARDRFLANMSHELRTPLHGIIGVLNLAERSADSAARRRYLDMAKNASYSLQARVKELLDLSCLQSDELRLTPQPFNVYELMDAVTSSLAAQALQANLKFSAWSEQTVPVSLIGDAERLKQVLINLGANAIKFTPAGEVEICIRLDGKAKNAARVVFSVTDTGIGISREEAEKIFDPFHRVDDELSAKQEGSGLGLAISNQLIKAMGGEIKVDSMPGEGSRFSFALDLPLAQTAEEPPGGGMSVSLAVSDSNLTESLIHMLSGLGLDCTPVHTEAMADGRAQGQLWLIDSDTANGRLAAIAEKARQANPPARLAVLRDMSRTEEKQSRIKEVSTLLLPLRYKDMRNLLVEIKCGESPLKPATVTVYGKDGGKPQVLVAEDNPISQSIIRALLLERGMDVDLAEDGEQASAMAASKRFDFIFLDLRMPGKDGLSVAAEIRGLSELPNHETPIAAISAQAYDSDKKAALQAGMNHFLTKPLNTAELDHTLTLYFEALSRKAGNLKDDWRFQLREIFLQTHGQDLAALQAGLGNGNLSDVANMAHRFKSSLILFADEKIMEHAANLQASAEAGNINQAEQELAQLQVGVSHLAKEIIQGQI